MEDPIIPICRPPIFRSPIFRTIAALWLASAGLIAPATPAWASLDAGQQALSGYVRARLADDDGALEQAVRGYAQALALDPDSRELARRSYRQAIQGGDYALALRAARLLDRDMVLPPDGPLLLLGDALRRKDWKEARRLSRRLALEGNFAFVTPITDSWIALGEGKYAPPVLPQDRGMAAIARRYIPEHRALQALARGDAEAAMPSLEQALAMRPSLQPGLHMVAAGELAALGRKDAALALLDIDDKDAVALRARIGRGEKTRFGVRTPAQGYARLLFQLAGDLTGENSHGFALAIARMASFADPANDEYRVKVARELLDAGHADAAAHVVAGIGAGSPFAAEAGDARIAAALEGGEEEQALAMARAAAAGPDATARDFMRLGGILARREDFAEAADAYSKAIDAYGERPVPWSLHLLRGGALEQGGEWEQGRAELEKAEAIAPNEPIILNYLGYAQIERRQNVRAALSMLEKASGLRPDDPAITDSLGWAHYVNGDVKAAIPVLERAVVGAPDDAAVNEHLGDAYWTAGRRFEARYAWNAAYIFADKEAQGRIEKKIELGLRPDVAAP